MSQPYAPPLNIAQTLSSRHMLSWFVLSAAAGAVNAGSYMACQRFVTHVTGTLTLAGLDIGEWLLMLEYSLVFISFVVGAFVSVFALQARVARGLPPAPYIPLILVMMLILAVTVLGVRGVFGPMGGHVEQLTDFELLCLLALAMGMMNATVASSTALGVRTTHMTGPATDVGVFLGLALILTGDARKQALRTVWLRFGGILFFVIGAIVMEITAIRVSWLAFLVPAVLVLFATVRSLGPQREERAISQTAPTT